MKGSLELQYTHIYINCTDEFHTLRHRVVRCICTIFLCAWLKKMCDSCTFVKIQCYKFPLYYIFVWNKELLGLKKQQVDNKKIYIMKKAIMLHSGMSCHCTSCHFLIIQLDEENFNHMPSPIFCDVPLNHLLITT